MQNDTQPLRSATARALSLLSLLLASLESSSAFAASITTDRQDYVPGMTAVFTGEGWQPNETVTLHLDEAPAVCPHGHTWTVTADSFGDFTDTSFHLELIHIGVTFTLQATGSLSGFTAGAGFTDAAGGLDQARNGSAASPNNPILWANGNANSSQSHYVEGQSVPYRMVIAGLTTGSHSLVIEWDITAGGGSHAIDFITHYDRLLPHNQFGGHTTPEAILPTDGIAGTWIAPDTFPIPSPSSAGSTSPGQPTASFNSLPANERVLSIWNGTITSAVYLAEGTLSNANQETSLEITFVTTNSTVIIAWGGHIASKTDWGVGNSAVGISGSPYHMRLISLDGSGGNQDRSFQAEAVVSPPSCPITGPGTVCAGTTNTWFVTTDTATNFVWGLSNNTSGAVIVGPTNMTNVTVAAGSAGSYTLVLFVSSNELSSVCAQLVTVLASTTSVGPTNVALSTPTQVVFGTTPSGAGPFTFVWRRNGTVISEATNSTFTVSNATPADSGIYCVEVTGACNAVTNCATLFVDTSLFITCPADVTMDCTHLDSGCTNGQFCTYTQGGWGSSPAGMNPGTILSNGFTTVYPGGFVEVGIPGAGGFSMTFTSASAIEQYIPAGMMPASLTADLVNPTNSSAGVFGGQVLALQLNVDFCDAGVTPGATNCRFGDFILADPSSPLFGKPVREILAIANTALGGGSVASNGVTLGQLNTLADRLNNAFDDCTQSAWARMNLMSAEGPSTPPPSDTGTATATDNCDLQPIITHHDLLTSGSCFREIRRTWTATDACGNSNSCVQIIRFGDATRPMITCASNKTVECGQGWDFDVPTATDNCSDVLVVMVNTMTNGLCGSTFSATRTWSATDQCGNSNNCSQTITVVDSTPPALLCGQDRTVECGTAWSFDQPTVNDTCDGTNVTLRVISTVTNRVGFCGNTFSVMQTWEAIDACTNSSRCSQTITVVDSTPPALLCGQDRTVECGTAWSFDQPTVNDTCDGTNVTLRVISTVTNRVGFCGNTFSVMQTWEALDACTNSSRCSQTITVVDSTPPALSCGQDHTVECGTAWSFDQPTVNDTCDGTNVTLRVISTVTNRVGFCGNTFSAMQTWEAIDACTNSSRCSQTITVVDSTPPALLCGQDRTVECGTAWSFDRPTANDTCDGTNVILRVISTVTNRVGFCGNTFSVMQTWEAIDACTNSSRCSQTITVVDSTPPALLCGQDHTVECGTAWSFDRPTVNDTCDGTNVILRVISTVTNRVGFCGNTFSAMQTWEAIDACTNSSRCSQTITVVDSTPPALLCGQDRTVECGTAWSFDQPTVNDTCDGTNVTLRVISTVTNRVGFCGNTFSVMQTWEALDACTNSSRCSQTITVVDSTPPALLCGQDHTVECGTAWSFDRPTANDTCDGTNVTLRVINTVTNRVGFCGNTFSAMQTWEAIDACTNSSRCSQTITVVDSTPPALRCGQDRTVECGTAWSFDRPTANDTCNGTNVTLRVISTVTNRVGFCGNAFSAMQTWEAIDACTNGSRCSQTITVVDSTPPALRCGQDRTVECGTAWSFDRPTANDTCDGTNVTLRVISTVTNRVGYCGNTFSAMQTWEAIDACTNSSRCSQTITVVDSTPPALRCGQDRTVECGTTWSFDQPTANDACDGTNVTLRVISTVTNRVGYCGNAISATRTWEAIDACTNISRCSQTISVRDSTPPEINCPPDVQVVLGTSWSFGTPTASDTCGNAMIAVLSTSTNVLCGNSCIVRCTWLATDACGNTNTCSQAVTVIDDMALTVVCAKNKKVNCGDSWDFQPPSVPGGFNNVNVVATGTVTNEICGPSFTATRTWEASDNCGNRTTCSQTVTVKANLDIDCAHDKTVECGQPWDFDKPNVTSCDDDDVDVDIVYTTTTYLSDGSYQITRKWRVRDACGNEDSCKQVVTVRSATPPLIRCAQNKTVECGSAWEFDPPLASDQPVTVAGTVTNDACGETFTATRTWEVTGNCGSIARCSQTVVIVDTVAPILIGCPTNLVLECGLVPPPARVTAVDPVEAVAGRQILLNSNNIVGGSGSWENTTWNDPDSEFNAFHIVDEQTGPIFEPWPGNFWLGRENTATEHIVLDLGKPFFIDRIDLFNTHNHIFDDRRTKDFQIHAANSATNAGARGLDLAGTIDLILSDRLTFHSLTNDPIEPDTFTPENGLRPAIAYRYLRFETLSGFGNDNVGLNEIRIFGRMVCDPDVPVSFRETRTNGACPQHYTLTRTWVAADDCGNSNSCTQTIEVHDTRPPVIACPPDGVFQSVTQVPPCPATLTLFLAAGGRATDTCDTNLHYSCSDGPFVPATSGGVIERRHTVSDSCGNSNTCVQLLRIVETNPPVVTPLADPNGRDASSARTVVGITVNREAGLATLNWSAVPGVRYRVEYKSDSGAPQWTALPGEVIATGTSASKEDALGGQQSRFYRVLALP